MPPGGVVAPANANDGCHPQELLAALVAPPALTSALVEPEGRSRGKPVQVAISANGLLLVALGLYPTALMTWCATAF